MATRFSNTLFPTNNTDTDFRAWIQWVEDLLVTTGGWVVTADTGQMTIATASKPTGTQQKIGYRIYRMNDALQATSPVFMRIDYGSGPGSALNQGMWLTIGTGSDGSGTITNIRFNGGASVGVTTGSSGNSATTQCRSYGSADTGRFAFCLFVNTTNASYHLECALERSKDSNGVDTGDGLILVTSSSGGSWKFSQYIILGSPTQPNSEPGLMYILSNNSPSTFQNNGGLGLHFPMKGVIQQPGLNVLVVRANDLGFEGSLEVSIYGQVRKFQHLGFASAQLGTNSGNDSTTRVCMRFD